MSVKSIKHNIENKGLKKLSATSVQQRPMHYSSQLSSKKQVSFQGSYPAPNVIVKLMDFIAAGGFAASFIIQDGLGFIAPRVGKGLVRGGKEKKDENGNVILDKNGKPKRKLNWEYARKEGVREIITGPSAFLIPLGMLHVINKKFGSGNNVKLNYIDNFRPVFTDFAKNNIDAIKSGTANRAEFYENVYKTIINDTINKSLPDAEKMSEEEIAKYAKKFTDNQIKIEDISADKSLSKKQRKAEIAKLMSIEDEFMLLKKNKLGGIVDETAVNLGNVNGKVRGGSIGELVKAMKDYFGDAVNSTKKAIQESVTPEQIENVVKNFSNRRMGSRILTNLGIFGTVAAFYTQIPKLYNMGLKGNPALNNQPVEHISAKDKADKVAASKTKQSKNVAFTGMASFLEKTGQKVIGSKGAKSISDIFELNGPIISGSAMATLLYTFCIPPRLSNAQDKYDYKEIIVRDLTSFSALLFGANALSRIFSDGFTKVTGLALNRKNMADDNFIQKVGGYLSPSDGKHHVLSTKELNSKYTNVHQYKDGISGFADFIEQSGGSLKKAFAQDKNIKEAVDNILQEVKGTKYEKASDLDIKQALKAAHDNLVKEVGDNIDEALKSVDEGSNVAMKKLYKLFQDQNGLLNKAKTCNSAFGFLSTLALVPGLIMYLTHYCEKMTAKRIEQDKAAKEQEALNASRYIATQTPTMAGFLAK